MLVPAPVELFAEAPVVSVLDVPVEFIEPDAEPEAEPLSVLLEVVVVAVDAPVVSVLVVELVP